MERCFICNHKMDKQTNLCTNKECVRSQFPPKKEETNGKCK
nr:MAG TPA: hypothetical protein [Caudoviricetes sp.]